MYLKLQNVLYNDKNTKINILIDFYTKMIS